MGTAAGAHPPCVHPSQVLQELPRMEIQARAAVSIHPVPCRRDLGWTPVSRRGH